MAAPPAQDRGLYILFAILFLYAVIFSSIGIWRYEHFICEASGDHLLFSQVIHNTAHGRLLYNNFSQQSHLGDHNSPILALLAPFSLIVPAPWVLSIFSAIAIAAAAIPVYLLTRAYWRDTFLALLSACCFAMLPTFVGQFYTSFHEINLVPPFLTFAFYFFVRERFVPFVLIFFLGLSVKEDVALTLFMFSPYAALQKRERHWCLFPAVVSVSWFLLSIKEIIPLFNKRETYGVALSYFSNLGSSLSELVVNTVSSPLKTLGIMVQPDRRQYLFALLLPVGLVLPFFAVELFFAIPSVFFNLLADNTRFRLYFISENRDMVFIPRHMSLMTTTFIFIAAMQGLKKLGIRFGKLSHRIVLAVVVLLAVITLYSDRFILFQSNYVERAQATSNLPTSVATKKVLALVPRNATVKANIDIANHLYDRKESYYPVNSPEKPDYIIMTRQDHDNLDFTQMAQLAYDYAMVTSETNIGLYKKLVR